MIDFNRIVCTAGIAFAFAFHPNAIPAQTPAGPQPALLVLSPTPLANGHVNVRRGTATQPYDLIIVDSRATETEVTSAVAFLGVMRSRSGGPAKQNSRGTVMSAPPGAGKTPADGVPMAKRLHDLPHAASRTIKGLGKVHAIPVNIP